MDAGIFYTFTYLHYVLKQIRTRLRSLSSAESHPPVCPDWVKFILDRPMSGDPGISSTITAAIRTFLSAILTKLKGMSALEYARFRTTSSISNDSRTNAPVFVTVVCAGRSALHCSNKK
jgi:hypothetical protein